jgi:hypothetical protein
MCVAIVRLIVGVALLASVAAAAINEFYFYPAGQPPANLPAPSDTTTNIALATWYDAQVHSAYPATPFGLDESALACETTAATAHVLVVCTDIYAYFAIKPVQCGWIYLYTYGAAVALPWLSVGVARVTTAWQEDSVTWATCPALDVPTLNNGAGNQIDTALAIDVQTVIEAERQDTAGNRHGFALLDLSGGGPLWFTRESAVAAYRPYLHVAVIPEPAATLIVGMFLIIRAASRRITSHRDLS